MTKPMDEKEALRLFSEAALRMAKTFKKFARALSDKEILAQLREIPSEVFDDEDDGKEKEKVGSKKKDVLGSYSARCGQKVRSE